MRRPDGWGSAVPHRDERVEAGVSADAAAGAAASGSDTSAAKVTDAVSGGGVSGEVLRAEAVSAESPSFEDSSADAPEPTGFAGLRARMRRTCARRRAFLEASREESAVRNLTVLQNMAVGIPVLLASLLLLTDLITPGWSASVWHLASLAVFVAMGVGIKVYAYVSRRRSEHVDSRVVTALCLVFQCTVLGLIAVVDTVGTPLVPGLFMQALCVVMVGMYVLPAAVSTAIVWVGEFFFIILSLIVKIPPLACADIVAAASGLLICTVLVQLVMRLRVREYEAGAAYKVLSTRDALTGLANKATFMETARHFLDMRNPEVRAAFIMLDIDDFKGINDRFGHLAGDEVLRGVGRILGGSFRASDTSARFGGDEFSVLALGFTDADVMAHKLEEIQAHVRELGCAVLGEEITVSIGVVIADAQPVEFEHALRLADRMLYETKRGGKGSFSLVRYPVGDEEDGEGAYCPLPHGAGRSASV